MYWYCTNCTVLSSFSSFHFHRQQLTISTTTSAAEKNPWPPARTLILDCLYLAAHLAIATTSSTLFGTATIRTLFSISVNWFQRVQRSSHSSPSAGPTVLTRAASSVSIILLLVVFYLIITKRIMVLGSEHYHLFVLSITYLLFLHALLVW